MKRLDEIQLSDQDRAALQAAAAVLRERFEVEELLLYGSKARGEDEEYSDIDMLVLLGHAPDWQERRAISEAVYAVSLAHDVIIHPVAASRREWWEGPWQFLLIREETRRDGVLVP